MPQAGAQGGAAAAPGVAARGLSRELGVLGYSGAPTYLLHVLEKNKTLYLKKTKQDTLLFIYARTCYTPALVLLFSFFRWEHFR